MNPHTPTLPVLKPMRRSDKKPARSVAAFAARTPPDLERIRVRAYQIWEQEGRPNGRDREHWQEAERQLQVEFRVGFPDGSGLEYESGELAKPGDLDTDETSRLGH